MTGDEKIKKKLNALLYCCECLHIDYCKRNYGDAERWVRHISNAYSDYQETIEESEENVKGG